MAPGFFSKFVKATPSTSSGALNGQDLQRTRSPSPSPSSQYPFITVDPSSPASVRPRRHTTVGNTPHGSTDSFPNVTVVPPSPRSTNNGSDITDDDPTPKSTQSPTTSSGNRDDPSAKRVPSLPNLGSPSSSRRSGSAATDEEGLTTPTPASTRTTFTNQAQDKSLSHPRSSGNLRGKSSATEVRSPANNHPRSATMAGDRAYQSSQESLHQSPTKSGKSKGSHNSDSLPRTKSQSRHDRAVSVPSIPVHPLNVITVEDGLITSSPISDSPQTSMSLKYGKHPLPNVVSNLQVPDKSDTASTRSRSSTTTSSKRRRAWSRKPANNGSNSAQPGSSPATSTISLSPTRKPSGNALAKNSSGLAANNGIGMTPVTSVELPPTPGTSSSVSSPRPRRSSEYSRNDPSRQTSLGYPASELSDRDSYHSEQELLGDQSGLEDDDDLDLDPDDIPVTGFAVASNKRNQDFHELFPTVPDGDYLIDDYGCALQREILIQGRLYVSENHMCFHANIFGWITDLSIPIYDVTALDKRMTAFVIPNAIQVTTTTAKYTFTSFLSRDNTFDVIYNVWRLARPEGSSMGSHVQSPRTSIDIQNDPDGLSLGNGLPSGSSMGAKGGDKKATGKNKVTRCACEKDGGHFSELAMESIFPGTPEKIYNLMFTSGFIKDFMIKEQKLTDLQISDWMPTADNPKLLYRKMSYTKPLNGGIGPKQTRCEIRDETIHCDFDDYVVMLTATRTPEVPSGGVFVVKTKTCMTWASSISTKVVVTTEVEWTGRSFIKGLIEKSAIEGQKQYHTDLDRSMRQYIHEHRSEFLPDGVDASIVEETESKTTDSSPRPSQEGSFSEQEIVREYSGSQRYLQWAYDTWEGALKVTRQSIEGLLELTKEAWDQSSSTTILYFIIVFLVISNVWTLTMVGRREEVGRRKEMRRTEEREKWVQNVVTTLWEELMETKTNPSVATLSPTPRPISDWREEVSEINNVLDSVTNRVQQIRESLAELD